MRTRGFLVLCVLGLTAATGSAQPRVGPTQTRPAVSPYLNLLRPGNSAGLNYYGLVRPQLEFRNNIQDLQQQVTSNEAVIADFYSAAAPMTGHRTSFLNTGGYFAGGARVGGSTGVGGQSGGSTGFGGQSGGATGFGSQPATRPMSPRR